MVRYFKNNLSLFFLFCIIFLFPVKWYTSQMISVDDFKGVNVMLHDYFRIFILYILVIMIQAVSAQAQYVRLVSVIARLLLLVYFVIFPLIMYQIPETLFRTYVSVCCHSYGGGFYMAVILTGVSMGIDIKKLWID